MFERALEVGLGVGPPYSVELTEKSSISCWDNDLQRSLYSPSTTRDWRHVGLLYKEQRRGYPASSVIAARASHDRPVRSTASH